MGIVILAVGYDQRKIGKYECELDVGKIVEEFGNEKGKIRDKWEDRRPYNLQSAREFLRKYMEQTPIIIRHKSNELPPVGGLYREDLPGTTGVRLSGTSVETENE